MSREQLLQVRKQTNVYLAIWLALTTLAIAGTFWATKVLAAPIQTSATIKVSCYHDGSVKVEPVPLNHQ